MRRLGLLLCLFLGCGNTPTETLKDYGPYKVFIEITYNAVDADSADRIKRRALSLFYDACNVYVGIDTLDFVPPDSTNPTPIHLLNQETRTIEAEE
jgi:hypothetical protein